MKTISFRWDAKMIYDERERERHILLYALLFFFFWKKTLLPSFQRREILSFSPVIYRHIREHIFCRPLMRQDYFSLFFFIYILLYIFLYTLIYYFPFHVVFCARVYEFYTWWAITRHICTLLRWHIAGELFHTLFHIYIHACLLSLCAQPPATPLFLPSVIYAIFAILLLELSRRHYFVSLFFTCDEHITMPCPYERGERGERVLPWREVSWWGWASPSCSSPLTATACPLPEKVPVRGGVRVWEMRREQESMKEAAVRGARHRVPCIKQWGRCKGKCSKKCEESV